jgi:hypothetical protein
MSFSDFMTVLSSSSSTIALFNSTVLLLLFEELDVYSSSSLPWPSVSSSNSLCTILFLRHDKVICLLMIGRSSESEAVDRLDTDMGGDGKRVRAVGGRLDEEEELHARR